MTTKSAAAKRSRGRPAHVPTAANRRKVSIAAGGGMRHEDIAIALGINRDTLAKYYEAELSEGAFARRLEVLQAMHTAARKGSSSAARAYLEHEAKLSAPPAPAGQAVAAPVGPAAKSSTLGKKEQANIDARGAQTGTDWETLLNPPASVQ